MKREPVFDVVTFLVRSIVRAQGLDVRIEGVENIPAAGGVVLTVNHTAYLDFMDVGLITRRAGRYPRFMMKAELRENRILGFLMKHCKAIGVDRSHGAESYHEAVQSLRAGELVVVYPEATISRSFELKQFKSGAARMALDSGAVIVPLAIWGAQRIWTKDIPKRLGRNGFEIVVVAGRPIAPDGDVESLTGRIRAAMQECLDRAQADYPAPAGAGWVPRRLGGSAPTLDEALVLEEREMAERRARKAAKART